MTRRTLPSTQATGSSNAIEAMAAAVYGPIPGNLSNCEYVSGRGPPSNSKANL